MKEEEGPGPCFPVTEETLLTLVIESLEGAGKEAPEGWEVAGGFSLIFIPSLFRMEENPVAGDSEEKKLRR